MFASRRNAAARILSAVVVAAAALTPAATAQTTFQLFVAETPDRAAPTILNDATLSGDAYVFVAPAAGVRRVSYWIDDPGRTSVPDRIQRRPPFDLEGLDGAGNPRPFDTTVLSDGSHNLTAELLVGRNLRVVLSADFTVSNTPGLSFSPSTMTLTSTGNAVAGSATLDGEAGAAFTVTTDVPWLTAVPATGIAPATITITADPSGLTVGSYQGVVTAAAAGIDPATLAVTLDLTQSHSLQVSATADMSAPRALSGAVLAGDAYVFITPDTEIGQVTYYLDDPSRTGAPLSVITSPPFPMMGSSGGIALPFDTSQLTDGAHHIAAEVARTVGGVQVVEANFSVDNTVPRLVFSEPDATVDIPAGTVTTISSSVVASDGAPVTAVVTGNTTWISVAPASGSTPRALTVTIDAQGLTPGIYAGTVTATAASYSAAVLPVSLRVRAATTDTILTIVDGRFSINGASTNPGTPAEGLLINSRMVQAAFDDEAGTPELVYPDTGLWDAERNLGEFLAFVPVMAQHGLDAVTIGMQGGNPWPQQSNTIEHPEVVSTFASDGSLKPAWQSRLERVIAALDDDGMVAILSLFYQHQADELADEQAVIAAVDNTVAWLTAAGYGNVMIEISNEVGPGFPHGILRPSRVHELVERVVGFPVSVSHAARGSSPTDEELAAVDYVTLHSNGLTDAEFQDRVVTEQARTTKPIVVNEGFPVSHLAVALSLGVSWGFHDDDRANNYVNGFQAIPVNWTINTPAKYAFFSGAATATNSAPVPAADVALSLAVTPSPIEPGSTATATITATNAGPSGTGVEIGVAIPAGVAYTSHTGPGYDAVTGSWVVTITPGGTAELDVVVTGEFDGDFTIGAEVVAADLVDPDSIPRNQAPAEDDIASASVSVRTPALLFTPGQVTLSLEAGLADTVLVDLTTTTGAAVAFDLGGAGTIRVMPVGDSVTRGEGDPDLSGYREILYDALVAAGHTVDFVGSLQDGTSADPDHEGHEGWRAHIADGRSVRDNVYAWLTATPADIVLLHIGTNDIFDGQPAAAIAAEIAGILDEIDRWETERGSRVHVVLARIINRNDPAQPGLSTETTLLNAELDQLAAVRLAAGDALTLVDMESALTYPDDLADTVHPNPGGYAKMAAAWLPAVTAALAAAPSWPTWLDVAPVAGSTPASLQLNFDSSGLLPGFYTADIVAGSAAVADATLTVTLEVTPSQPTAPGLLVSQSADRSGAVSLDGEVVGGEVFIFWWPETDVDIVGFWLDNTRMRGRPGSIEFNAPFDWAGTAGDGSALPFDVSTLSSGAHTMTVRVTASNGANSIFTAAFTVS